MSIEEPMSSICEQRMTALHQLAEMPMRSPSPTTTTCGANRVARKKATLLNSTSQGKQRRKALTGLLKCKSTGSMTNAHSERHLQSTGTKRRYMRRGSKTSFMLRGTRAPKIELPIHMLSSRRKEGKSDNNSVQSSCTNSTWTSTTTSASMRRCSWTSSFVDSSGDFSTAMSVPGSLSSSISPKADHRELIVEIPPSEASIETLPVIAPPLLLSSSTTTAALATPPLAINDTTTIQNDKTVGRLASALALSSLDTSRIEEQS